MYHAVLALALDHGLNVQRLVWGVPVCLTTHNLEEALGAPASVALLRRLYPWFVLGIRTFLLSLVVVTAAVWLLAALATPLDRTNLLLAIQAILFVNAFVPHLLLSVRFRRYTPGVATATLLVIPWSIFLLYNALAT